MKRILYLLFLLGTFVALIACSSPKEEGQELLQPSGNQSLHLMKLSSKGLTDQQASIQAKHFLSKRDDISRVRAVNYDEDLIVAIDVHHLKRLSLKKIQAEVQREIDQQFSNLKVTLSTDQKILLELKKLEEKLENDEISDKDLKKKIERIKKLSKEET